MQPGTEEDGGNSPQNPYQNTLSTPSAELYSSGGFSLVLYFLIFITAGTYRFLFYHSVAHDTLHKGLFFAGK